MKKKRKFTKPKWAKIKFDYLAGKSMHELSILYGVAMNTLYNHSSREGWAKEAESLVQSITAEEVLNQHKKECEVHKSRARARAVKYYDDLDTLRAKLRVKSPDTIDTMTRVEQRIDDIVRRALGLSLNNVDAHVDHTSGGKSVDQILGLINGTRQLVDSNKVDDSSIDVDSMVLAASKNKK